MQIRWQYNFRYPALNHLTAYLSSKLLWNPSLDVDALLEDYYLRFYGPACLPMKEFWNKVETLTMERPAIHPFYQYDPDSAIALCALLEKAREATPEKSRYRQRVEMIQAEFVPSMEAFLKLQKRPLQEATLFSHPLPLEKRLWMAPGESSPHRCRWPQIPGDCASPSSVKSRKEPFPTPRKSVTTIP